MDVPSHVPHLSNEILARIIEFLEGDLESLKACSVTCHSFLYPARKHIFHHVHITIRNCAKFLQFLDANTNLGVHVRELHIVASNPMEQEVTWVDKYLPLLAPKLPNVVHLELKGKDRYKSAPFRGFQSVKRLTIERTQVNNLNDFCALTGMFPRLEETWCHDLFVYRILTDEVTAEAYNPPRNLRITHFSDCRLDPAQYVDWMVKHDLYRNLEHFSSCPLQQVGLPAVGKIAKAAGPALKWWKLAMVGMVTQGGFVDGIRNSCRLDQNPNLETIEFGSPAQYADLYGSDDIGVSWFPAKLSTIVSTVMEEVVFFLWGGKEDSTDPGQTGDLAKINDSYWDDVVSILSGEPFIGLKKISFHITGNVKHRAAIVEAVSTRFAGFKDTGVLVIDDMADPDCR